MCTAPRPLLVGRSKSRVWPQASWRQKWRPKDQQLWDQQQTVSEQPYRMSSLESNPSRDVFLGGCIRTSVAPEYIFFILLTFIEAMPYCCCSVAQLCPTLRDPMSCSTPGFPVLHHHPQLAQTHIHWIGDAIQPSYPRAVPKPPHSSTWMFLIKDNH